MLIFNAIKRLVWRQSWPLYKPPLCQSISDDAVFRQTVHSKTIFCRKSNRLIRIWFVDRFQLINLTKLWYSFICFFWAYSSCKAELFKLYWSNFIGGFARQTSPIDSMFTYSWLHLNKRSRRKLWSRYLAVAYIGIDPSYKTVVSTIQHSRVSLLLVHGIVNAPSNG